MELSIFPLSLGLRDLKDLAIKNDNIVSFDHVSARISFFSLFAQVKPIDITIHRPRVILDEKLLKKGKKKTTLRGFKINKIDIVDGHLEFRSRSLFGTVLKFHLHSLPGKNSVVYRFTSPHLKLLTFPKAVLHRLALSMRGLLSPAVQPPSIPKKLLDKLMVLEGQVICEFRETEQAWKISKFYWQTPLIRLHFNGNVFKDGRAFLSAYAQGSADQMLDPVLGNFKVTGQLYSRNKIIKDRRGRLSIQGNFNYNTININGENYRDMRGTLNWDSHTQRLKIDAGFHDGKVTTTIGLQKQGADISLLVRGGAAPKVAKILDIYKVIPLGGFLKEARVRIRGRLFRGVVEMIQNPENHNPDEFNAAGTVDFTYHGGKKSGRFFCPVMTNEFGQITDLHVMVDPRRDTRLAIDFNSRITEAAHLEKYTQFYINLPLNQWRLQKGSGGITMRIRRIKEDFSIDGDIRLTDFFSGPRKIRSLIGQTRTRQKITTGTFDIDDQELRAHAIFNQDERKGRSVIRFEKVSGESKKILDILDMDLDLHGPMNGRFVYTNARGMKVPVVRGHFRVPRADFYGFPLGDIRGDLEYSDSIRIKKLSFGYMKGAGSGDIFIDFNRRRYRLDGKIQGIDLNHMNGEFNGTGDLFFSGRGAFERDPIIFRYRSDQINFFKERSFAVNGSGTIHTDFSGYSLQSNGRVINGDNVSPFTLHLNQEESRLNGKFHATVNDINLLIPWGDNQGEIDVDGRIFTRRDGTVSVEGHAEFKGKYLSFPNFPQTVDDFSGDMLFKDLHFTLRSLRGTLGDGAINCSGYLHIDDNQLSDMYMSMSGRGNTLNMIDRAGGTVNADLSLQYMGEKLLLSGNLDVLSGAWEREMDEGVSFYTNPSLSATGSSLLDMLEFDLKIVSKEEIRISNALGNIMSRFDLNFSGNRDFPELTGVIESRNGTVTFSGKKFDLVKAKLDFNNKFIIDPLVDIEAEAFIKNYRIKFTIKGRSSKLKPELQSSPPLPTGDILTLITVGELFRRPTSTERGSQIGLGTTDLLASELTEQIKKRTRKIFGNYMLRFDPNISSMAGASFEDTSRLIVGKEIARDFLIVYSTNFSTRRQQVVYVQYQLTPSVSLIGMRNEEGELSIELRYRKRQ